MSDLRAELRADGGAAAAQTEHFFRSPAFYAAEAASHSLVVEAAGFAVALVVRPTPDLRGFDAISPYGYPGAVGTQPLDPDRVDWRSSGLVSLFLRDRIGAASLLRGTLRQEVFIADPAHELHIRDTHRRHVRRNARLGYETVVTAGPEVTDAVTGAFGEIYRETMTRARAIERYRYPDAYFRAILASDRAWLALTYDPTGRLAAGAVAVMSDEILHYYLGGSSGHALEHSPLKSTLHELIELGARLGTAVNFGGGRIAGDALEDFKRGFANRTDRLRTHELVADAVAYERLATGHAGSPFFPSYRTPATTDEPEPR